jgi:hypothetical protein
MKKGLAAFVVGMLWSSFVLGSSMCGMIGAWLLTNGAPADDLVAITFMRDGRFFLLEAPPTTDVGFERGTFSINPANGQLTVSVTTDTNGDAGLSHAGAMTAAANGNVLVITDTTEFGTPIYHRIRDSANPIVGSWLHESGGTFVVFTFLADGRYVMAQDGTPAGGGMPGVERGTYTWNAQTGAFTATAIPALDKNGEWGLSHGAPPTVTVLGSRMTFSDDGTAFTRVGIRGACQRKDSDGDGKADLLWRHTGGVGATGHTYIYPMDGRTIKPNEGFSRTVADLDWRIEGRGDFNGDGMADILWRHYGTGENYIYLMNGTTIIGEGFIRTVADMAWRVERVNDFNGDRKDDIVWYHTVTGETYLYPMDGLTILPSEGFMRTVPDLNWRIERATDVDGDGRADLIWRRQGTGENYIWTMDGTTVTSNEGFIRTVADPDWDIVATGDYDDDGFGDIVWRHLVTGENYIYFMRGTTIHNEGFIRTVADLSWVIGEAGDFDGDGKTDLVWRNLATGENYIYFMDGLTIKPTEGFIRTVTDQLWTMSPAPMHEAVLRINEVNANIANNCDLIELRAVLGGRMGGMRMRQRLGQIFAFPAFNVAKNDIVVVHFGNGAACNPGGSGNETSGKAQFAAAQHPSNYDTAWDFWSAFANAAIDNSTLSIEGRAGNIIDAVLLASDTAAPPLILQTEQQAAVIALAGQWQQVGGGVPAGGFAADAFLTHAVRGLGQTGTVSTGTSIQRINNGDTHTKADWTAAPAARSFGALNAGQTPF